jgi:hypothetical protein
MKITVIAGLAAAALLAACGGAAKAAPPAPPAPMAVTGQVAVQETCAAAGFDYPDITAGAQVIITSPSGAVLDTGTLAGGTDTAGSYGTGECDYLFTAEIPGTQPRYGITVGRNRGTIWFTRDQMRNGPALSLGP